MRKIENEWGDRKQMSYTQPPLSGQNLYEKMITDDPLEMMKKMNNTINRRTVDYNSIVMRYLQVA